MDVFFLTSAAILLAFNSLILCIDIYAYRRARSSGNRMSKLTVLAGLFSITKKSKSDKPNFILATFMSVVAISMLCLGAVTTVIKYGAEGAGKKWDFALAMLLVFSQYIPIIVLETSNVLLSKDNNARPHLTFIFSTAVTAISYALNLVAFHLQWKTATSESSNNTSRVFAHLFPFFHKLYHSLGDNSLTSPGSTMVSLSLTSAFLLTLPIFILSGFFACTGRSCGPKVFRQSAIRIYIFFHFVYIFLGIWALYFKSDDLTKATFVEMIDTIVTQFMLFVKLWRFVQFRPAIGKYLLPQNTNSNSNRNRDGPLGRVLAAFRNEGGQDGADDGAHFQGDHDHLEDVYGYDADHDYSFFEFLDNAGRNERIPDISVAAEIAVAVITPGPDTTRDDDRDGNGDGNDGNDDDNRRNSFGRDDGGVGDGDGDGDGGGG